MLIQPINVNFKKKYASTIYLQIVSMYYFLYNICVIF